MSRDPWSDPSTRAWVRHVIDDMVPKLESSAVSISLVPEDGEGDVKFWVELGASIMLDKPILAVVLGGRRIPARLERVADEIVVLPAGVDPAGSQELAAAVERMLRRHRVIRGSD